MGVVILARYCLVRFSLEHFFFPKLRLQEVLCIYVLNMHNEGRTCWTAAEKKPQKVAQRMRKLQEAPL